MKLFGEIRRRKVIQASIAYAVVGWLLIQLAMALEASLELPPYVDRWATIGVIVGFPLAVILAWLFEISLDGIRLTPKATVGASLVSHAAELAASSPSPLKHSIAVLPFADMSPDKSQEYLGDGVAEEILNALVTVTPLKVSGRTSSFSFKGKNIDVREIGALLNVAHVLEGSVRKHGDKVRITAQLVQASDGFHLWSETYDGELTDIFDLQDTIARSIVRQLEILLDVDQVRLVASMTKSPEAYDAFLKGRRLAQVQDGEGVLARAVEHLEEAVRLDPNFARAWAWLANAHFFLPEHNETPDWKAHFEAGKKAATTAYGLDPDLSDANLAMSYVHLQEHDLVAQWEVRKRAHELDPSSVAAMHEFGMAYGLMGLYEQAYPFMQKSIADDPFSPIFTGALGVYQWALGDAKAASASFDRSVELGVPLMAFTKGAMMAELGQPDAAHAYIMSTLKAHKDKLPAQMKSRTAQWLYSLATTKKKLWAKRLIWLSVKGRVGNPKYVSDLGFKAMLIALGEAKALFGDVRQKPNTYLSGALMYLWAPTASARAIRTHPDFPRFAEDIGLVRAWQKHGWPPQIKPKPGTDGSSLQFTCR